jgi:hypothetical protein
VASRVDLTETPDGWELTLTMGDDLNAALVDHAVATGAAGGAVLLDGVEVSVTIAPNLVPGGPFPVARVNLIVSSD